MSIFTKYILSTFSFIGLASCGHQPKSPPLILHTKVDDGYKPLFTNAQIKDTFEVCYKKGQLFNFGQLFVEWNKTVKPNSDSFIRQNDTIYAIFAVYKAFYKPFDLLKLGNWEWGNNLNSHCIYVAVQNRIYYSILGNDSLDNFDWKKFKVDSIENFRPPINLNKNKVLYLTKEYDESLTHFLGTESTKLGEGNIMSPSRPQGESNMRYRLLRSYIPILHGHWGGYWHLSTNPHVRIIVFNKALTMAQIDFRVGYQGGKALLVKHGMAWTIKKSEVTWIE